MENGFDKERVEEVLHSIELGMRHQSSNFGLSVLFGVAPLWNHGVNVLDALRQADQIAKLRTKLAQSPSYLQVCNLVFSCIFLLLVSYQEALFYTSTNPMLTFLL